MKRLVPLAGLAALTIPAPVAGATSAESVQATIAVSADVVASCHLRVTPLQFSGATDSDARADTESAIAVGCTPDTAFAVSIDDGQNAASGQRRMAGAGGAGYLAYDIYRNAARTQRWGAGHDGAATGVASASGVVTLAAYARITQADAPAAGTYRDIITVSVSF